MESSSSDASGRAHAIFVAEMILRDAAVKRYFSSGQCAPEPVALKVAFLVIAAVLIGALRCFDFFCDVAACTKGRRRRGLGLSAGLASMLGVWEMPNEIDISEADDSLR